MARQFTASPPAARTGCAWGQRERGSFAFDLERLNELELYDAAGDATTAGFRRVLVTEADHPWISAWWPPGT